MIDRQPMVGCSPLLEKFFGASRLRLSERPSMGRHYFLTLQPIDQKRCLKPDGLQVWTALSIKAAI